MNYFVEHLTCNKCNKQIGKKAIKPTNLSIFATILGEK